MNDGCIIKMTLPEFFNDFHDKVNISEYFLVLVSQDIKAENFPGCTVMNDIIPTRTVVSLIIDDDSPEEFKDAYYEYLSKENQAIILNVLMMCILNKNSKILLMCSQNEYEVTGYIDLLAEYIRGVYGIEVYDCKSYKKLNGDVRIKNKKRVQYVIDKIKEFVLEMRKKDKERDKKTALILIDRLLDYDKRALIELCEEKAIAINSKTSKDEIIRILVEYLVKNGREAEILLKEMEYGSYN
jgi:hypothetical protein